MFRTLHHLGPQIGDKPWQTVRSQLRIHLPGAGSKASPWYIPSQFTSQPNTTRVPISLGTQGRNSHRNILGDIFTIVTTVFGAFTWMLITVQEVAIWVTEDVFSAMFHDSSIQSNVADTFVRNVAGCNADPIIEAALCCIDPTFVCLTCHHCVDRTSSGRIRTPIQERK